MSSPDPGERRYRLLPDGRFLIPSSHLSLIVTGERDRILDVPLGGRPARVLLLDRPFRLGDRVEEGDGHPGPAHYLERIRLRDLPGWPPRLAAPSDDHAPPLSDCRLIAARFKRANASGQEGIEFELAYGGMLYAAWLIGSPLPLLRSALETLNGPGVFGNRMSDVQDMRLVGDGLG